MIAHDPCRQPNKEFLIETISIYLMLYIFQNLNDIEKTFQRLRYNLEKKFSKNLYNIQLFSNFQFSKIHEIFYFNF